VFACSLMHAVHHAHAIANNAIAQISITNADFLYIFPSQYLLLYQCRYISGNFTLYLKNYICHEMPSYAWAYACLQLDAHRKNTHHYFHSDAARSFSTLFDVLFCKEKCYCLPFSSYKNKLQTLCFLKENANFPHWES